MPLPTHDAVSAALPADSLQRWAYAYVMSERLEDKLALCPLPPQVASDSRPRPVAVCHDVAPVTGFTGYPRSSSF